ncbi:hypothetical protein [uncultured Mameliella sp.]|uniref:hypothetical protein n=1 Tax=uncultured Mameliella sp. TaxID=1447087 RepID=UPI0026324DDD|nr:hypothetical protein [uncultured Mameliella sp.]
MIRIAFLILLSVWPLVLSAQTVTVRSGEHGEFTRLVLTVPAGTKWALSPDADRNQLGLELDGGPYEFDTSSVFDRIGTGRIRDLVVAEGGRQLDIALACQCEAEAFVLRNTMLVVDISASEVPLAQAVRTGPKPPEPRGLRPSSVVLDLSRVRIADGPRIGPEPVRDPGLSYLAQRVDLDPTAAALDRADRDPSVARDLGNQIAADLAIAATQGLLDPAVTPPPAPAPKLVEPAPKSRSASPAADPGEQARQLAAGMSGLDHKALQKGRISIGGDTCLPDSSLALATWAKPDDDPNLALAKRRSAVFGEFDRIGEEALLSYAKTLIYYGFGAEARSVLSLQPEVEAPVVTALSYLVDGDGDPMALFSRQAHCEGPAALWSVLFQAPPSGSPQIAESAILRSFEALPKHLRTYLGPILVEHLATAGYPDTARDVLRRMQRMEGQETDSIALGKAQLALRDGDPVEAGKRLQDLSIAGGPEAARAVAAAIDLAEATDAPVPTRIVELSDAFATELRNSEDGPKLWQAHVRSLLINGHFDTAFNELDSPHGMPPEIAETMRQTAMRFLVDKAADVTFLKFATRALADGENPGQDALGIAIAERFLDLGLADSALQQLDTLSEPTSAPEARIARARALLALDRPEEAEIILIGQRGDEVARLRAEARSQMGDHVFAKSIFADAGKTSDAVTSAWLSGDWQDVAESDTALAPAAELMQQDPPAFDPARVSLAGVDAVFDASIRSRETLRTLLDVTAIPPNP